MGKGVRQTMKLMSSKEQKKVLLEILEYIDKICRSNNIRYWLAYGTLIGAVRHDGFIPWDDDIDINMPREDYKKFLEIMKKEKGNYKALLPLNSKGYNYPFAKVVDKRTYVDEKENKQIDEMGVYVDVFPLDGLGNTKEEAKKRTYDLNRNAWWDWGFYGAKVNHNIKGAILKVLGIKRLYKYFEKRSEKIEFDNCKYVGLTCFRDDELEIYDRKLFDNLVEHNFEGKSFLIPEDYDKVLSVLYGNYMELLPEEKRVSLHNMKCYFR